MPHIEENVYIDRSPEDVWAFISKPENLPVWNSGIISAEAHGEMQVGTRVSGQFKFLGKTMDWVNEMTAFDPPKTSAYKSIEAPFAFTGQDSLEPEGSGTRLTSVTETESMGGFFGKMSDPIVAKMFARQVRSDLENLKEILESQ